VLIKPDNFRFPNARPGGVHRSVFPHRPLYYRVQGTSHERGAGDEFYGPVLDVLKDKLRERSGKIMRSLAEKEFDLNLDADVERQLGEVLGR
jgi:hypothetical protein